MTYREPGEMIAVLDNRLDSMIKVVSAVIEAAQLKRNTTLCEGDNKKLSGTWVAVPHEDFEALRKALEEFNLWRKATQ